MGEKTGTALATREPMAMVNPQDLLSMAIEKGAPVETLERLVALAKDVRAVQAKEAYNHAMAEFQRRCPQIGKTKKAQIRLKTGGSFGYSYAPIDEIMSVIRPIMGELGLSVGWVTRIEANKVIANCRVSHEMGHSESSGDLAMPVGTGDTGASPAQQVGIALNYCRRYSLLTVAGLTPTDEIDDDGASAGRPSENMTPRSKQEAQSKESPSASPENGAETAGEGGSTTPPPAGDPTPEEQEAIRQQELAEAEHVEAPPPPPSVKVDRGMVWTELLRKAKRENKMAGKLLVELVHRKVSGLAECEEAELLKVAKALGVVK